MTTPRYSLRPRSCQACRYARAMRAWSVSIFSKCGTNQRESVEYRQEAPDDVVVEGRLRPWHRGSAGPCASPRRRRSRRPGRDAGTARPASGGGIWAPARTPPQLGVEPGQQRPCTTVAMHALASRYGRLRRAAAGRERHRRRAGCAWCRSRVRAGPRRRRPHRPAACALSASARRRSCSTAATSASACSRTWARSVVQACPSASTTRRNEGRPWRSTGGKYVPA